MAQVENEKPLTGDMEKDIVDQFDAQVKKLKLTKKKVIRSLALFWLELSDEEQKGIYYQERVYVLKDMMQEMLKEYLESQEGAAQLGNIMSGIGEAPSKKKRRKS